MRLRLALTLRSKLILIVLGGAVLPLALFGVWLNRTAQRSGEQLLRTRLEASLSEIVDGIGLRWLSQRSRLLELAESRWTQEALGNGGDSQPPSPMPPPGLTELFASMASDFQSVTVLDATDERIWTLSPDGDLTPGSSAPDPALTVQLGVHGLGSGTRLGTLRAQLHLRALLPGGTGWGGVSGSVLAVLDPLTGASLLPTSIDPGLFAREEFIWGDEPWVTVHHTLYEPAMELALAAPLSPFTEPFEEAAERNLWILGIVAVAGFFLATLMTRRITRKLVRLAEAAEAVSTGDLDRRVEEDSGDEVGRVGRAFNAMTESLQRTLQKLSQRQALAAVGEFASGLAHEVRNPLTSVRLDMQRIEEELPQDSKVRNLLQRALGEIDRVNRSVTGALRVARSGTVTLETVDLRQPLQAAAHAAEPEIKTSNADLVFHPLSDAPIWVKGDAVALEQLLLNLLLNAAQSLERSGTVEARIAREEESVIVVIRDTGRGISREDLERITEPFFSTRPQGTGLGLAIAQRIAEAHGRGLEFESTPGVGTMVRLVLPASGPPESVASGPENGT